MTEDILERAKKADIDLMAITDWGQLRDLFGELIAEIERLRSENKIISDRAAHHEKQDAAEIELLAARIKELEALNELNHKNMRSWLDTTTDKEFLDKLSSEIGFKDAYIKRLEAAFLDSLAARLYYEHYPGVSDAYSWHDYPEDACHCMPKEKFREKAREALERIKAETGSGDHVAGANKLILTAEQREEEGKRDA